MYKFQASLFWSSLVHFGEILLPSCAKQKEEQSWYCSSTRLHRAHAGHTWQGKGSTQGCFLGFLLIGKGWDVVQGVLSVSSRNEKAACRRMAFSTEGQCSALKWRGGFDGPSRAPSGFHGIQAGFVPMPWLVVGMGSLGVSSAIKAIGTVAVSDRGCR